MSMIFAWLAAAGLLHLVSCLWQEAGKHNRNAGEPRDPGLWSCSRVRSAFLVGFGLAGAISPHFSSNSSVGPVQPMLSCG